MEFHIAKLDKGASILTVTVTVLLTGLAIFFITVVPYGWIFAILIFSIILLSFLLSPAEYRIEGGNLTIRKIIGRKIEIPLKNVEAYTIEPDFTKLRIMRTFGNGGLFGYYGMFSTAEYGPVNCQLTRLSEVLVIKTNQATYALSPAQTGRFEEYLASTIRGIRGDVPRLDRSEPVVRGRARSLILIVPAAVFILTLAMVLLLYAQLPERIAVHFDLHGTPDGWASRTSFIISGIIPAAVLFCLSTVIFFYARRAATGSTLPYSIIGLFVILQLLIAFITLDTYWINSKGIHLIPFPYNIATFVVVIGFWLFIYYWKIKKRAF
jgi:hypothetical protein